MFEETSIAQKEAQGAFTKTSSPLVASFKVGASLCNGCFFEHKVEAVINA